jgi:hypothetical protein
MKFEAVQQGSLTGSGLGQTALTSFKINSIGDLKASYSQVPIALGLLSEFFQKARVNMCKVSVTFVSLARTLVGATPVTPPGYVFFITTNTDNTSWASSTTVGKLMQQRWTKYKYVMSQPAGAPVQRITQVFVPKKIYPDSVIKGDPNWVCNSLNGAGNYFSDPTNLLTGQYGFGRMDNTALVAGDAFNVIIKTTMWVSLFDRYNLTDIA